MGDIGKIYKVKILNLARVKFYMYLICIHNRKID
jgi:hypothetical protein